MDSDINNILKNLCAHNYINSEIKIGKMKNNYFNYNIDKVIFDKIFNFYNDKYNCSIYSYKRYEYIDLYLIENNNNFNCYKNVNFYFNYINFNNMTFLIKNNLYLDLDTIYFPRCNCQYKEEIESKFFLVKFKNSTLRIEFLNINNKYNSIILKINQLNNSLNEINYMIKYHILKILSFIN